MQSESGATVSLWMGTAQVPKFTPLEEDTQAEVAIIGAGIAGLTTAYLLAQAGYGVLVLDDNAIGGGETQRTTAHLSNVIDNHFYFVMAQRGLAVARMARESHGEAVNLIELTQLSENIECDFLRVNGYLYAAPGQSVHNLRKEFQASGKVGFSDIEWLESLPLGFCNNNMPAIRYPRQAQFHVLKYLDGLAGAIVRQGGRICTGCHVDSVAEGTPCQVHVTSGGAKHVVKAQWVVAATNTPVTDYLRMSMKQAAYRTYVVAVRVPVGYVEQALFWDMANPYHYTRTEPIEGSDKQWLIVGGEDHRTGQESKHDPERHSRWIETYARRLFPAIQTIEYRWSGQVQETPDGLGLIGRDPEHQGRILIASGDSGMGITHGTIAGMILRDMIAGVSNPWEAAYDPARWPVKSAPELVSENARTAMGYLQYFDNAQLKSAKELGPGQAAVIEHKGHRLALYRDFDGHLHQLSGVCPHARGPLVWNDCEHSWDCAAHGSRFRATGEVIDAPAICDMMPAPQEALIEEEPGQGFGGWNPPTPGAGSPEPRH